MRDKLFNKCISSVHNANLNLSKLNEHVLKQEGMSSQFQRHLLNNVCDFDGCKYLEVGSYLGSTICSASFKNNGDFYGVENFSEFVTENDFTATHRKEHVRENLYKNISALNQPTVKILEKNFFTDKIELDKKINIFSYDGIHREQAHFLNLKIAKDFLDEYFIYIVDDWFCNVSFPKKNTFNAINSFNFEVLFYSELLDRTGTGLFLLKNYR